MIKLTKAEKEILLHRLNVSEAIADVLADTLSDIIGKRIESKEIYESKEFKEAIEKLYNSIEKGYIPSELNELEKMILAETIEGSTYISTMIDEVDERIIGRYISIIYRLAEKIEKIINKKLDIPIW